MQAHDTVSLESDSGSPALASPPPEPPPEAPRRPGRARLVAGALVLALGGGAWAVASRPAAAPVSPAAGNDAPKLDGNLIRFSEKFAARAGLRAEPLKVEKISPQVGVQGTVTYDPRSFAAVGARIDGRVRRVLKFAGDIVRPGDVLAEIESAELGRAEAAVLGARAKEKAAEADMKRERRLADARITAERDAELARASFEAAHAERIAAERTVQALGGDLVGEIGVLVLRAPIAGRVVAAKVARGQTVDPTVTLFEIADLGSLWVELGVFERDIHVVRVGDKVELTWQGGGEALTGEVAHVGDIVDVATRTAPVRVVVSNEKGLLRPGQSVHARVQTTAPATTALSAPRRGVTRVDGKPTVFVMHDANTVEPRAVVTGPESGSRVAILEGVREGERIVVDGMFALKSEIFR